MGMLKKLFNSENKYYLELDEEAQDSQPVQEVVENANKVADAAPKKAAEIVESQPVQENVKTATQVIDQAQEKLQSATEVESEPAEKKTAEVKSIKSKNSGASSDEPPFWVAAMYNTNNSSSDVGSENVKAEQTFSTDNLMPTITNYRRRPGPSLNKFRDMANKARTPRG